jgi:hypothetical protein
MRLGIVLLFTIVPFYSCKKNDFTENSDSKWHQAAGIPIDAYICDLTNFDEHLFAATSAGIYRSDDDGHRWIEKSNGLLTEASSCRAFSKSGNRIYVENYRCEEVEVTNRRCRLVYQENPPLAKSSKK